MMLRMKEHVLRWDAKELRWIESAVGSPQKKNCKGFPPSLNVGEGSHPKQKRERKGVWREKL